MEKINSILRTNLASALAFDFARIVPPSKILSNSRPVENLNLQNERLNLGFLWDDIVQIPGVGSDNTLTVRVKL